MTTTPEKITDLISGYTDLKDYFEQYREQMEPFMAAVQHPHQVTLEVGDGKQFAHPIDAYLHINNHAMSNNIAWKMVLYPGIYDFPYKGHRGCHFDHSKQVEMVSSTGNAADVVLQGNSEDHDWLIIADHHCHLTVSHITFRDSRELNPTRVDAVNNRNLVNNNAGGIVYGVLVRFGSTLNIAHCQFNHLWTAIAPRDSSQVYIDQCAGSNICYGITPLRNSFASMSLCQWTGIGDTADTWRTGAGVGLSHGSVLHAHGNVIRNFRIGVYSHWNSDAHVNRFHRWGDDDGRTPIDVVDGRIENCYHGVHVYHNSGGYFANLSILNSQSHAFLTGTGSSTYAYTNVTIDGAHIGFYSAHNSSIVANSAVVRNCRGDGFHASYLSEIHASGTQSKASGNATNYSPAASHTMGNYGALIYIS